jgi:hypothetical protein
MAGKRALNVGMPLNNYGSIYGKTKNREKTRRNRHMLEA